MKEILKCENIYKNFGSKEVLKDVSLSISEGDILAFIGPNGAGKTTLIKIILGLQTKKNGKIIINNCNIDNDFVGAIKKVGAIVENPDSYMYLTGYQNLKLIANYDNSIKDKDIKDVISLVGLDNRINDKVSKYSLGMRQRLGIAKALLNKPNLLILDEPTNGLDPEGIKELRELLVKLSKNKMGILVSSHNLAELESFCNKVCIINKGIIIDSEEIGNLKKQDQNKYIFKVNNLNKIKDKMIQVIDSDSFVYVGSKEDVADLVKKLVKQNIDIYEIKKEAISLEQAYLAKTGGNKID